MADQPIRRTKRSELIQFVEGSDTPLRLCHVHGFLPMSSFYESSIKRHVYSCMYTVHEEVARLILSYVPRSGRLLCGRNQKKREARFHP